MVIYQYKPILESRNRHTAQFIIYNSYGDLPMNRTFRGIAHQYPFSREVVITDVNRTIKILRPDRSQALKNHSPDGFNWGYPDSGCAQLALGILLEVTNDEETALLHYNAFTQHIIATITDEDADWTIEEWKIKAWLEAQSIS